MCYNNQEHLKLISLYLNFKNENKSMISEDSTSLTKLRKYEGQLCDHLFWVKRSDFFLLIRNYITNSINIEQFNIEFSFLWYGRMTKFNASKFNLAYLNGFDPDFKSQNFSTYMTAIFRVLEELEDEISSEDNVKNYILYVTYKNFPSIIP